MIDLDALRVSRPLSWPEAQHEPRAAEPLLLAPLRPVRPLPVPAGLPASAQAPRRPTRARSPAGSRTPPAPGPSGSGGAGAGGAGAATSTSRSYRGRGAWAVASRDLDPASVRALLADPDAPFARPGDGHPQGLADHDRRRADADRPRPADAGHLQAVQPQEVARPVPDLLPAVARLAGLAGGPAPGQPGDPDARRTWPSSRGCGRSAGPAVLVPARTRPTWSRSRPSRRSRWATTSARSCRRSTPSRAATGSGG